jgi:hypothetical protein
MKSPILRVKSNLLMGVPLPQGKMGVVTSPRNMGNYCSGVPNIF